MSKARGNGSKRGDAGGTSEQALSAQMLQAALQTAAGAIVIMDEQSIIRTVNPAAEQVFGFDPGELVGQSVSVLMPEPYRSRHDGYVRHHLETGERRIIGIGREVTGRRKSGALFAVHLAVSTFESNGRKFFTGVIHDLSQHQNTPLLREQVLLQAIFNQLPDAVLVTDPSGRIILCNPAVSSVFGYSPEQLIGCELESLCEAREEYVRLKSLLEEKGDRAIDAVQLSYRHKSGAIFPAQVVASMLRDQAGATVGLLSLSRDITSQVEREEALRKSQRLEAIGQLTGGIAHDFNNLLTIITGNHELLEFELETDEQRDLLARANNAALMGGRLTSRLLTFARRRRLEPALIDLNEQIMSMTELLRRTLGEALALGTQLAPRLWLAKADPSEVESTVLNLAINARDAMPGGGRLVIETTNVTLGSGELAPDAGIPAGDYVRLRVSDTGVGMPPEVLSRAFEPFFSTKPPGKGTGLGLSVIYGFVRQSGGTVTIGSEVGRGTTVTIYLPRAADAGSFVHVEPKQAGTSSSQGETVLLVEDNDEVRAVTARRLRRLGYKVEQAENGPRAVEILQGKGRIDIVLSDVVMPGGMSGFDLANWMRANVPHIPVLLTSGFAEEIAKADAAGLTDLEILRKPYAGEALAAALRKAMRGAR